MKLIPLTQGLFAKVSNRDYPRLRKFKWHALRYTPKHVYAARERPCVGRKRAKIFMHCAILGAKGVDHRNFDTLDNQRRNLRRANGTQNQGNTRLRIDNTSGFKGVCVNRDKWRAQITVRNKVIYLGSFLDPALAASAYDRAAKNHFGKFANLNFPKSNTKNQKPKS